MPRRLFVSLAVGIAFSLLALYLALRNVPLKHLSAYLNQVNYLWMGPAVLAVLVSFLLRVWRWQIILGHSPRIGFWDAHHPLMIGFMINCILPGRVGEIARPVILKKRNQVPLTTGLATVAAERAFDMVVLLAAFILILAFVEIDPQFEVGFGELTLNKALLEKVAASTSRIGVILIVTIALVSMDRTRNWINGIIKRLTMRPAAGPSLFKRRLATCGRALIALNENIAAGFATVKSPRRLMMCALLSVMVWGVGAGSYYLVGLGCPGVDLGYSQWVAVLVLICFFIALPSVPGYWGLWEAGGVFALRLFGVSADAAAGATLLNHALQILPVILVGFVSAWIASVNILKVSYAGGAKSPINA